MTDREVMQQALEALESGLAFDTHSDVLQNLRKALEQQAEPICPECKAAVLYECVACSSNNYPPKQQAEPVSMRLPKVGDKVICLEDESLGEVVSLTAGGSPDITFDDGSRGTYLLREFAELFSYAEQRQQQAGPVAWDKPSASFNGWWDSYRHDPANPFAEGSAAYWAWAGWQAAKRQWVGLEAEDLAQIESDEFWQVGNHMSIAMAVEAKLKERNND